jgi:hypothetical protein
MFRSYDHYQVENILLARITQLTTDPLFYNIANIIYICPEQQLYQLTQLVIKYNHYNVSDIIKQRIRCQLSNPS